MPVVPPLAIFLAKHEVVSKFDLSAVKSIVCGAAPLSGEVQDILSKRVSLTVGVYEYVTALRSFWKEQPVLNDYLSI